MRSMHTAQRVQRSAAAHVVQLQLLQRGVRPAAQLGLLLGQHADDVELRHHVRQGQLAAGLQQGGVAAEYFNRLVRRGSQLQGTARKERRPRLRDADQPCAAAPPAQAHLAGGGVDHGGGACLHHVRRAGGHADVDAVVHVVRVPGARARRGARGRGEPQACMLPLSPPLTHAGESHHARPPRGGPASMRRSAQRGAARRT